jgi:hypothetical protein
MKTVVPLNDQERRVLTDFADGDTPHAIHTKRKIPMDKVTEILFQRAGMSRPRARDLVSEPDPREASPLTAPISRPAAAKAPAKVASAPVQKRGAGGISDKTMGAIAEHMRQQGALPPAEPVPTEAPSSTAAAAQVAEPEPVVSGLGPAVDMLDLGIGELSDRLRLLVVGLAQDLARRHRAAFLRVRVGELEAELADAKAELAAAEPTTEGPTR